MKIMLQLESCSVALKNLRDLDELLRAPGEIASTVGEHKDLLKNILSDDVRRFFLEICLLEKGAAVWSVCQTYGRSFAYETAEDLVVKTRIFVNELCDDVISGVERDRAEAQEKLPPCYKMSIKLTSEDGS